MVRKLQARQRVTNRHLVGLKRWNKPQDVCFCLLLSCFQLAQTKVNLEWVFSHDQCVVWDAQRRVSSSADATASHTVTHMWTQSPACHRNRAGGFGAQICAACHRNRAGHFWAQICAAATNDHRSFRHSISSVKLQKTFRYIRSQN